MRVSKISKGRCVLYLGEDYDSGSIGLEMSKTYNFGLGWNIKREETKLQFRVYLFKLISVWVTFETIKLKYRNEPPMDTGITWQPKEHVIKVSLCDQTSMDSSKPSIVSIYWNYRDWLFGRSIHSESSHRDYALGVKRQDYYLEMPEGRYKMKLDYYTSYWHRPRSPFVRSIERVTITPEKPVPIPGKGENSWDMDEDATHSSTMPVKGRTPEELIADFKQNSMKRRERYGGKNWLPESAQPSAIKLIGGE